MLLSLKPILYASESVNLSKMPKRAGGLYANAVHYFSIFLLIILVFSSSNGMSNALDDALEKRQPDCALSLGAVVDSTSLAGKKEKVSMEMALKDFYGRRTSLRHYPTLHVRNSRGDPIRAASSAKILIKKHHARAIIGFKTWQEAISVAQLGNEYRVPIVSLANKIPPLCASCQWPFLVSAARSLDAQMKAVAAIIQSWQWRKVNIIYEDFNPAISGITPNIIRAIKAVDAEINELLPLSPFSAYPSISEKLESLKNGQCRVFIVHTSITLATKIFKEASEMGMMGKDFVWITTNDITSQIDSLNASSISSMQGVLGVKSYFSTSNKRLKDFQSRFRVMFRLLYPDGPLPEPGTSTLQAYDAAWAVALALEGNPYSKSSRNGCVDKMNGEELFEHILKSNFEGLTGAFNFSSERKLAPVHIFRLVNVVGKSYRKLGYWTEGLGFSESIHKLSNYSKSMNILGQVFWPGGPWSVPRGWAIPTSHAYRLKIGVPEGSTFKELVNVAYDRPGGNAIISGFSIEVFNATLGFLPYHLPYAFIPLNGTYDHLVEQIHVQNLDAVVGDIAIVSNRSIHAEFSQPYTESGLQMLIYIKPKKYGRAWLFQKPFTIYLWALTGVINVYNGFVVWLIERNHRPDFRGSIQNQIGTMLSLSFTTLFSLKGEKLHSNLSRMAMTVWLFVALVLTQSFTASLTTLLTVQSLDPINVDIETLIKSGAKVGCDANSFVVDYLGSVVGFDPKNIVGKYTEDDYPEALKKGEIKAAFLQVPYVKIFLAKYCEGFTTSGPTLKVGGLGFAFARNSPYLPDISEAVLKVSETGKLQKLWHSLTLSLNCSEPTAQPDDTHGRLGLNSFCGLFVITGGTSTIALFIFIFHHVRHRWYQPSSEGQQHHNPANDELLMFGPEIQNWNQSYLYSEGQQHHNPVNDELLMFGPEIQNWNQSYL